MSLAKLSRRWRNESMSRMPVAAGDIREIAGQIWELSAGAGRVGDRRSDLFL